jgi:hypothetical protein
MAFPDLQPDKHLFRNYSSYRRADGGQFERAIIIQNIVSSSGAPAATPRIFAADA